MKFLVCFLYCLDLFGFFEHGEFEFDISWCWDGLGVPVLVRCCVCMLVPCLFSVHGRSWYTKRNSNWIPQRWVQLPSFCKGSLWRLKRFLHDSVLLDFFIVWAIWGLFIFFVVKDATNYRQPSSIRCLYCRRERMLTDQGWRFFYRNHTEYRFVGRGALSSHRLVTLPCDDHLSSSTVDSEAQQLTHQHAMHVVKRWKLLLRLFGGPLLRQGLKQLERGDLDLRENQV